MLVISIFPSPTMFSEVFFLMVVKSLNYVIKGKLAESIQHILFSCNNYTQQGVHIFRALYALLVFRQL